MPRVQITAVWTTSQPAKAYAYFAWDESYTKTDGSIRMRGRLQIWDVTNENNISKLRDWRTTDFGIANENHWNTVVAANTWGYTRVALFFYRQLLDNPCQTYLFGRVANDRLLDTGQNVTVSAADGSFPTMAPAATMGDYIGTDRVGLDTGQFLATWAEPVATTAQANWWCPLCSGTARSLVVKGALVTLDHLGELRDADSPRPPRLGRLAFITAPTARRTSDSMIGRPQRHTVFRAIRRGCTDLGCRRSLSIRGTG